MSERRTNWTARLGWITLLFLLGVILWGAYVRASGSGAGCGSHWPLCNGEVIPLTESTKTWIEFTHRVTSGLSLLLCFGLCLSAWRNFPARSFTRRAGIASLVFILLEALLGAGLVLLALVEQDKSVLRTVSLGIHLLNTFFLIAAVTLTAYWAGIETPDARLHFRAREQRPSGLVLFSILMTVSLLILGASGAMTALGDTLFPASNVAAGLREDLSPTSHFLIRLRVIHPTLAILVSIAVIGFAAWLKRKLGEEHPQVTYFATLLAGAQLTQVFLGILNILLLAPTGMQLTHLLFADLIWLLFTLTLAAAWISNPNQTKLGASSS